MSRIPRPRSRRGFAILGAVVVAILAGGFALAYFVVFPQDSPDEFTLPQASAPKADASAEPAAGTLAVVSGSQAGYRVREKLAFLSAKNEAVGRTSAITGSATLAKSGTQLRVTKAGFEIDVSQLKSDKAQRDQRIRSIGIESDKYPKASYELSKPLTIPAAAQDGGTAKVDSTGVLTMHGQSRTQTIPLQLRMDGSTLEAVGSVTFPWGRFGMTAPSVGGFVSVEPEATMEFDLKLARKS